MLMHVVRSAPKSEQRHPTVLCIHNVQATLSLRTDTLEAAGFRVFAASTANAAMGLFVAHEIDVVVSDQLLGSVSGGALDLHEADQTRRFRGPAPGSGTTPAHLLDAGGRFHGTGRPHTGPAWLPASRGREAIE